MLRLIESITEKKKLQGDLKRSFEKRLRSQGKRGIGYPGGRVDKQVFSDGDGKVWYAYGPQAEVPMKRYWNAFGIFDSGLTDQNITVEINIPRDTNSQQISGFFARDTNSGRHGDIVDALFDKRSAMKQNDEYVFNTSLIDLGVRRNGKLVEVFEVKTGADRESLYKAIGQLMVHSKGDDQVLKFMLLPADEELPVGFRSALSAIDIALWRFTLRNDGSCSFESPLSAQSARR
jgi:hypothetical protein